MPEESTNETICENCSEPVSTHHRYANSRDQWLCADCAIFCPICSCYTADYNRRLSRCVDCADTSACCTGCGEVDHIDNLMIRSGEYVCCDCHETGRIHDYNFKPEPIFYYGEGDQSFSPQIGTYYVGLEVETEFGDRSAVPDACEDESLWYAKHDGSLHDGVEFVSHPIEYRSLLKHFALYTDQITDLRRRGFTSYDTTTCGLHIHVSNTAFKSDLHLYKFVSIFVPIDHRPMTLIPGMSLSIGGGTTGDLQDAEALFRVSRRSANHLQEYSALNMAQKKSTCVKRKNSGKFCSVNLDHEETTELRLFRGTLNPASLRAYVEIIVAAVAYSRDCSLADAGARKFFDWVRNGRYQGKRLQPHKNFTYAARLLNNRLGDIEESDRQRRI